jgi:hypothetical protein
MFVDVYDFTIKYCKAQVFVWLLITSFCDSQMKLASFDVQITENLWFTV